MGKGTDTREIKIRSFVWKEKFKTFDGKTRVRNRMASRGEKVELEEHAIALGESMGAFVTDEDRAGGEAEETMLDLTERVEEMGEDELMNWVSDTNIPEIMDVAKTDTSLIQRLLIAENMATGNDPRAGLVEGLARLAGSGEEGEKGKEPPGATNEARAVAERLGINLDEVEIEGTGDDDEITEEDVKEFYDDEVANATDGAATLAEENEVFLADITGSGEDGRITKDDVIQFIKDQDDE